MFEHDHGAAPCVTRSEDDTPLDMSSSHSQPSSADSDVAPSSPGANVTSKTVGHSRRALSASRDLGQLVDKMRNATTMPALKSSENASSS